MRKVSLAMAIFLPLWAGAAELKLNFSSYKLNETPPDFRSTLSGTGKAGQWKVILDEAPSILPPLSPRARLTNQRSVLAQLARDKTDEHFPLLIYEPEDFDDFTISTKFKLVAGEVEQMAGIAFRIRDEKNYYYIRASGLGETFYFWKIVDGVRSPPIGAKIKIPAEEWHEMTIECHGNRIRATLNGKEVIPLLDDKSFTRGKIGFWTKSDAVSYFTDVRIEYTPKEILAQRLVRDSLKKYPRLVGLKVIAPTAEHADAKLIASSDPAELGQAATDSDKDVIQRGVVYYGKRSGEVLVTLPLHDSNGDAIAAVGVIMKSFPGQTEKNAIERALPIVKAMEAKVRSVAELTH